MPRVPEAIRGERESAIKPLFERIDNGGHKGVWVAKHLGMPKTRLWNYAHGESRVPPDFVEQVCALIRVSPDEIYPQGVPDMLIQKPRRKRTTQATTGTDPPAA